MNQQHRGPFFHVDSATSAGACVIAAAGELDLASAPGLLQALETAEGSMAEAVVLDLSGLTFVDSTGVRAVLQAVQASRAGDDKLRLRRGWAEPVRRVFELVGVLDWLPFEGSDSGERPVAPGSPLAHG